MGHALGLAAYPREGGGSATYYRSINPSVEAFAVDDTAVFVCIENDIVRVSLAGQPRSRRPRTESTVTLGRLI